MSHIVFSLIFFVLLIFSTAFLAYLESMVTLSLSPSLEKLIDEEKEEGDTFLLLTKDTHKYLTTILILKTGTIVISTVIVSYLSAYYFVYWWQIGGILALYIFLLMSVGEIIPKMIASQHFDKNRAIPLFGVIQLLSLVIYPFGSLSLRAATFIHKIKSKREVVENSDLASKELLAEEKKMLSSVFEFKETVVKEVMIPRTDMTGIPVSSAVEQAIAVMMDKGFSRLPVYQDTIDNIVGLLYAKDILALFKNGQISPEVKLKDILRPVVYVPEGKKVSLLLKEMQKKKFGLAIVVDEYGGTKGIVTMEDLLEEIVGEIHDEFDVEAVPIENYPDGSHLVDAKLSIYDLNKELKLDLPEGDYESIGGLVYSLAGCVPNEGEVFSYNGVDIKVEKINRQRIAKVRLKSRPDADEETDS